MNNDMKTFVTSNTPLNKMGNKIDIADLAVFLASKNASFITGQKIGVSGGFE
jgi:3-oxoacyl-[acyl-carrier protein] reductase/7-alpha-hydroxysteroid dehydrogenase